MYRLHCGSQLTTIGQDRCRLTDHSDWLELTAKAGQLPLLVHRLSTGFNRRTLYELLSEQVHPSWNRVTLWDRLGSWLRPSSTESTSPRSPAPLEDANLPHLAHLDRDELWARQQQVVHLNALTELGQQVAVLLSRQGWQTLISHDHEKITAHDTGLHFTSAHIDAHRTLVLAPLLRRINPWLNLVSAEALESSDLGPNHQMLWFSTDPEDLFQLGAHAAAQIATLPICLGTTGLTVGPWLSPAHQCLDCLVKNLSQIIGQNSRNTPTALDSVQQSMTAITTHAFLAERARQWLAEQSNTPVEDCANDEPEAPSLEFDSVFYVPNAAVNAVQLRLRDLNTTCVH